MLESGITFDCAQLVMDNEFARMIKHTVGGFAVDDEALALDVIQAVGPGGHFLSQDHTLAHMREQSQPELIDRKSMEEWRQAGSTVIYRRALEKARSILQTHRPTPLPADAAAAIQSIIEQTERELKVVK